MNKIKLFHGDSGMRVHQRVFVLLVFGFMVLVQTAGAMPAFARRYNMSCSSCHSPFPKLKSYGEQFMNNAYQLAEKEPIPTYKQTGD